VYPIDTGLARALSREPGRDESRLLETLVFLDLRRRGSEVEYVVTGEGHEVDFAATSSDGTLSLVQVCVRLRDPETRARELGALTQAMAELRVPEATLVTRHEAETIETDHGRIRVVPAWRFLLRHLYPLD
jgi:predicted AAA+ superfamily ATPase